MANEKRHWWNSTILAIGAASFFSDWSHETATTILPAFLLSIGGTAATLGLIEGVADGVSSFAKLGSGWYSDRLIRKKGLAVFGYFLTAAATAVFAFCDRIWQAMTVRTLAWFGRGLRTPVRKTLLAAACTPENYGKAFGLERAMDTAGAIIGPATALWILSFTSNSYRTVFLWSFVPGMIALLAMALFVTEKPATEPARFRFGESLGLLPKNFRWFLLSVGAFGLGDFSHTLLILFAAQRLTDLYGSDEATRLAALLYIFHNVIYATTSYLAGWLADHYEKKYLLSFGYLLGAVTVTLMIIAPSGLFWVGVILGLAGLYVGIEEALEDSLAAQILPANLRGTGFGSLAFVNAIGDFASSIVIGLLWASVGIIAFAYSGVLFVAGSIFVLAFVKRSGLKPASPNAG